MAWITRFTVAVAFLAAGVIFSPETFGSSSSSPSLYTALKLSHLLCFATAWGAALWVTFIGGIIMFKSEYFPLSSKFYYYPHSKFSPIMEFWSCFCVVVGGVFEKLGSWRSSLFLYSKYSYRVPSFCLSFWDCGVLILDLCFCWTIRNLPRHQFGNLQSKMFPAYFTMVGICCAISVAAFGYLHPWKSSSTTEKYQLGFLASAFLFNLTNLVIFTPMTIEVIMQTKNYGLSSSSILIPIQWLG